MVRRRRWEHHDELAFCQFGSSSVGLTGHRWRGVKAAVCRRLVRLVSAARCAAQQHTLTLIARTASDLRHCTCKLPSSPPTGRQHAGRLINLNPLIKHD